MTKRKKRKSSGKKHKRISRGVGNRGAKVSLISAITGNQFFRFLAVGVVNTGFSYGVYAVLLFFELEYKLANLGALVLGIIFSFNTQGRFVFKNANYNLFFRFLLCWVGVYFFNIYLIGIFIGLSFNSYVSGAFALIPVTLFSYVIQKFIVFGRGLPSGRATKNKII